MFDASSLTTQFMVLCLGASALSLLPLHHLQQWLLGIDREEVLEVVAPVPSPEIIRIQDPAQQPRDVPPDRLAADRSPSDRRSNPDPPPDPTAAPQTAAALAPPAKPDTAATSAIATPLAMAELIVDLSDRTLYWQIDDELYKSYPIAIGQEGWETPRGIFHVLYKKKNPSWQHPIIPNHVIPPGPDNPLGAAWIGFFVDGNQQIGFHGTSDEAAIGQAVSHGCIRLRNADILELYESVEVGWVVRVRS